MLKIDKINDNIGKELEKDQVYKLKSNTIERKEMEKKYENTKVKYYIRFNYEEKKIDTIYNYIDKYTISPYVSVLTLIKFSPKYFKSFYKY
jgi:predicted nucleic acid-binding protein